MVKKIVFVGPPGSGKSTLCNEVFTALKKKHLNVELIPEYARTYIQKFGVPENLFEQYSIFEGQTSAENIDMSKQDFVLMDSGRITAYFYTVLYMDKAQPRQRFVIQDLYRHFLDDLISRRYDYIFYVPPLETYKVNARILNDGTRYQTDSEVQLLDDFMALFLTRLHKLDNVTKLDCLIADRLNRVLNIVNIA
jgi:nicotinamide riboside kinase